MQKMKVEHKETRSEISSEDYSPEGLHVLVVDGDVVCLSLLHAMLTQCQYNVTSCGNISDAVALITEQKQAFDIVLCDVSFPRLFGFELLNAVTSAAMDLPVIMMSANRETSVVMNAVNKGACDFLIKPIRFEELTTIWQHVIRLRLPKSTAGIETKKEDTHMTVASTESISTLSMVDCNKRNNCYTPMTQDIIGLKKGRLHWTVELHNQFVKAVNQLGLDKAVPKRILELMNVQGMTREHVTSHLQKYRQRLRRLSGSVAEPRHVASFQAATEGKSSGRLQIQPRKCHYNHHRSTKSNSRKIKSSKKVPKTTIPTTYYPAASSNNTEDNIPVQCFDEVAGSTNNSSINKNSLSVKQNAGSALTRHYPFADEEETLDNIANDCGFSLEDFSVGTVVNAEEARKPVFSILSERSITLETYRRQTSSKPKKKCFPKKVCPLH